MTVDEVLSRIKEWRRLVVNGVSINLDHLMLSECETLAAEIEQLRTIVAKLPTVDGVAMSVDNALVVVDNPMVIKVRGWPEASRVLAAEVRRLRAKLEPATFADTDLPFLTETELEALKVADTTLQWTNKMPTQPGLYLWQPWKESTIHLVHVVLRDGVLLGDFQGCGFRMGRPNPDELVTFRGRWVGPLPEPEEKRK